MWTIQLTFCLPIQLLIQIFYNSLQKYYENSKKYFTCCAIPKKKAVQHTTEQDDIKAAES